MKPRTKIVACVFSVLALVAFVGFPSSTESNADAFTLLNYIGLATLIGWIALLLSQKWGWWLLVVLHAAVSLLGIIASFFLAVAFSTFLTNTADFLAAMFGISLVIALPIPILVTDPPSQWDIKPKSNNFSPW